MHSKQMAKMSSKIEGHHYYNYEYFVEENVRWAYFRMGLLSIGFSFFKFGGPTIQWAYYPVGLLTGFYGSLFIGISQFLPKSIRKIQILEKISAI